MTSEEVRWVGRASPLVNAAVEPRAETRAHLFSREWAHLPGRIPGGNAPGVWLPNVEAPGDVPTGASNLVVAPNPTVLGASPAVVPPSGGMSVQLLGVQLGATGGEYIAGIDIDSVACDNVTSESDFVVRCDLPPTAGGAGVVAVRTVWGSTYTSAAGVLRFSAVEISNVTVSPSTVFNALNDTYDVTVLGKHFGIARTGGDGTSTRMFVSSKECATVDVLGDDEMVCRGISPPWTPGDFSVRVEVGSRVAVDPTAFQFQPPVEVSSVSPTTLPVGGGDITIFGQGLGTVAGDIQSVHVGSYACVSPMIITVGTAIRCRLDPGVGAGHVV